MRRHGSALWVGVRKSDKPRGQSYLKFQFIFLCRVVDVRLVAPLDEGLHLCHAPELLFGLGQKGRGLLLLGVVVGASDGVWWSLVGLLGPIV